MKGTLKAAEVRGFYYYRQYILLGFLLYTHIDVNIKIEVLYLRWRISTTGTECLLYQ